MAGLLQAHQIRTARIPTGFGGGNLGNKGAVAVSLQLESTSLCVVGAHLAAHRGDVGGRNANYHSIVERDCFRRGLGWSQKEEGSRSVPSYEKNACRDGFGVLDHDVVLWLGDLNYRFQVLAQCPLDVRAPLFDSVEGGRSLAASARRR